MSAEAWQALFARFLSDPAVEAKVRADPDAVAADHDLPPDRVRWLAALSGRRVRAFRRSQAVKDARRIGQDSPS